ncbi:MAG: hypothetical protein IKL47_06790 [Clostridia bacterium]|nr:hypothetical protein [Clostridia bacterium]
MRQCCLNKEYELKTTVLGVPTTELRTLRCAEQHIAQHGNNRRIILSARQAQQF